jgi:hypothetical protein
MAACAALTGGLLQAVPAAAVPHPDPGHSRPAPPAPSFRVTNPGKKLGAGWKASTDRAVTGAADTDGYKVLVADSSQAYAWKTAAALAEPGMPPATVRGNLQP